MEQHQHNHGDNVYTCPMHPEVKGKKGDKCPKCGMVLVPMSGENVPKVTVELTTEPQTIEAGSEARLSFAFPENEKHVPLDISHEMKIHLMIVDNDLSWFRHIHPEEQADGSYTIADTFPDGGRYILFSDFKPKGGTPVVDKKEITVDGNSKTENADFSPRFVSIVDGYTVTLKNGDDLKTNRSQSLEISVEKDGRQLVESDIEPYLAATAHIAMISKKNKDFLHIHPMSSNRFPIYAETRIKKPGIYRIWVEFQTNGKVHTADFTVLVKEGEKSSAGGHEDAHHGHNH